MLCDKVCQWLATGQWYSPGTPVSPTNKTDRHDITEKLLKVALKTINQKSLTPFTFSKKGYGCKGTWEIIQHYTQINSISVVWLLLFPMYLVSNDIKRRPLFNLKI